jgi:hypothetical protein
VATGPEWAIVVRLADGARLCLTQPNSRRSGPDQWSPHASAARRFAAEAEASALAATFVLNSAAKEYLVGDSDACIIGSAISQLSNLPVLDHPKLSEARPDPGPALELIGSDDACNPAMFNGSEALDAWSVAGFHRAVGDTVWIAQRYDHERRQRHRELCAE